METRKLIEEFPKGNPPIQIDIFKAVDYFIGLNNVYEIETIHNFTLIMDGKTAIFLNKNLKFKVKHFVLTHEFVEYLIQAQKPLTNLPYYLYKGEDKKFQSKINRIAAELLMPEWVFRSIMTDFISYGGKINNTLIKELSNYFLVSEKAITVRLKTLGYEVC